MTIHKPYLGIVKHYENCFIEHGDNHKGVDWPNEQDARIRYRVMLDLIRDNTTTAISLLDYGCGLSHLYAYLLEKQHSNIHYTGLDISSRFIEQCRQKYPDNCYLQMDIMDDDNTLPQFDYIIANGVYTEKKDLSYQEMETYFFASLKKLFDHAKYGLAFNVMSIFVDWQRDDLFHCSFDKIAKFVRNEITKNFCFRQDYQLHEFTCYLYR